MERTGQDVQPNGSGGLPASAVYDAANPPFEERPQQSVADRPPGEAPGPEPEPALRPSTLVAAAVVLLAVLAALVLLRRRRAGVR